MDRLIKTIFCLVTVVLVHGQGEVILNTRINPGVVDAPVLLADGTGPGDSMIVGLFVVRNGGIELLKTTSFRNTSPEVRKYIVQQQVAVPGIPPGAPATFRLRVWPTNFTSYEEAIASGGCYGEFMTTNGTPDIHVPALGDPIATGGAPIFIPPLVGMLPLHIP